jgi:glycine/D-amino acid oxidase-like deaminating enzyme
MLDRTHLQAFIDTSLGEEILGGRFCPEDGLLYPLKLVHGLLRAAQRYGASIARARVVQLLSAKETVTLETTAGSLSAKKVLVATNAWIGELLPAFARLVVPVRGQMLSYAPVPSVFTTGMAASLSSTGDYWQQRPDGTILLGGCRTAAENSDEGMTESIPSQEVQTALEHVLPRLFPHLNTLQVQQRWAGIMAFTPDLLPIADQAPDLPGCWGVGGFCGHGMPFGIRVSQLLAEAMLNETSPADLAIFRLARSTLSSN